MANEFDLDSFLDTRKAAEAGSMPTVQAAAIKSVDTVNTAAGQKVYDLDAIAAEKVRSVKESLGGKLGLDPDGLAGEFANTLASGVSGLTRMAGQVANLPLNLASMVSTGAVDEASVQAYNRKLAGKPQEGDEALLSAVPFDMDGNSQTVEQRLRSAAGLRDVATKVGEATDTSGLVDKVRRNELSDDLRQNTADGAAMLSQSAEQFDRGEILSSLLSAASGAVKSAPGIAKTLVSNPGAVGEYVAENVPQIAAYAANPALGAATNVAYGAEQYREGMDEYAKANGGQMPDEATRLKMGLASAGAALLENVGDAAVVKGMLGEGGGVVRRALTTANKEGLTEAGQAPLENIAHNKDTSAEDLIENYALGFAVGGSFAGGGSALGAGSERLQAREEGRTEAVAQQAAVATAKESGDINELVNPESESYNPAGAINVLHSQILSDEATPEMKAEALRQADDIESTLAEQVQNMESNESLQAPERIQQFRELRETYQARLEDNTSEDPETDQLRVAKLTEILDEADAREADPERAQVAAAQLEEQRDQLKRVQEANKQFVTDTQPKPEQASALMDQVRQSLVEEAQPAAQQVMTLTMANPDAIDLKQARALANSEESGLRPEQRQALRDFTEAQTALNAVESNKARTDIMLGGDGFRGLTQYRNDVRVALSTGNTDLATQRVDQLQSFADTQQSKADAITTAYQQIKGTNGVAYIAPNEDGVWMPVDSATSRELKNGTKLRIDGTSFKLRDQVTQEAIALNKAASSLRNVIAAGPVQEAVAPAVQEPGVGEGIAPVQAEVGAPVQIESPELVATAAPVVDPVESMVSPEMIQAAPVDPVVEAPVETGELVALRDAGELRGQAINADQFKSVNLAAAYLTQDAGKEDSKSKRPLVSTPSFLSALAQGRAKPQDFVDAPLTEKQNNTVRSFYGFMTKGGAGKAIASGFTKKANPEFNYKDPVQFLLQDGIPEQNLVTAIGFGMHDWINGSHELLTLTDESINSLLNQPSDAPVGYAARELLGESGVLRNTMINQIGPKVFQALGLKALPNANRDFQSRMETALGVQAVNALIKAGFAETYTVQNADLKQFRKDENAPTKGVTEFVRPTRVRQDGMPKLSEAAQQLREASIGSQSVLNKMFGVEYQNTEPTFEPVSFNQVTYKRTKQKVASVLKKALNKRDAIPFYVRQDMFGLWNLLDAQGQRALVGMVDMEATPIHGALLKSQEAKNAGLQMQIDNMNSFFGSMDSSANLGLDQPLYFQSSVWLNQRVGLQQNVINPQTSKLHRYMVSPQEWNETTALNDSKAMTYFQLRVMEAFGVKTEKKNLERTLAGYDALVSKPEIKAAVDALKVVLRNDENYNEAAFDQAAVVAGVKAGGENMHSFSALVALAKEAIARETGAESFEFNLPSEVDGVNNGPMFSLALLGAASKKIFQQGGFFTNEYNYEQFSDYHNEPGNYDAYEFNIKDITSRLTGDPRVAHIQAINGDFVTAAGDVTSAGRNIPKKPLTATMFGSAPRNAVDGMADVFLDTIYKSIQKDGADPVKRAKLVTAINGLLPDKRDHLATNSGFDTLMDRNVLSKRQLAAIKNSFYEALGEPTEKSLEATYAQFLARRNVINTTANLGFNIYKAVLDSRVEAALESTNSVPRGKNGTAIAELSQAEYQAIEDSLASMQPILHTPMSKASGELDAGLLLAKKDRQISDKASYDVEVNLAGVATPVRLQAMEQLLDGPGVGTVVVATHSGDSYVSQLSVGNKKVVNVHDAHIGSTGDAAQIGQDMNQKTMEMLSNYSIANEAATMLDRVMAGLTEQLNDETVSDRLQEKLKKIMPKEGFAYALEQIRHVTREADAGKFELLSDMTNIGQYATEGGSYQVTEKDLANVRNNMENIGSEFNDDVVTVAENLDQRINAGPVTREVKKSTPVSAGSVQTVAPATTLNTLASMPKTPEIQAVMAKLEKGAVFADAKEAIDPIGAGNLTAALEGYASTTSVFGKLGTPLVDSDPALVDMLVNAPNLTTKDLANRLAERATDPYSKQLLKALTRVARDLPVVLVTPDTQPTAVYGSGVSNARGWYSVSPTGFEALYVKSPQFVESGITEEMLTHELLHTVTGRIIQNELDAAAKSKGYTSEAYRLVQNLEAIRKAADVFIQSNGVMSAQYANAVSNVHELVSWGMSNQAFQEQVLSKISAPQDTRSNGLLNGLQKFIETLTKLVFRGRAQAAEMNGMAMLVANTSGLFAAAKQQMDARNGMTLKMEDAMSSVNGMSTREVFDALGQGKHTSASHVAKMESILDGIVDRIYGPMGAFKDEVARGQAITTEDAFLKALDTNQLPFASKALSSDFVFSKQEAFVLEQVEATVASSLESGDGLFIRNQLESLWNQARTKLSPKSFHPDWANATLDEKKVATAKYHFLFKVQSEVGDKNSYLARFAALSMANEEVSDALGYKAGEDQVDTSGMSLGTKVLETFNRLTAKLGNMYAKTQPNDIASTRLYSLVDRLVDIEAKRKGQMANQKVSKVDQAEMYLNALSNKAREGVTKLAESPFITNSRSSYVRAAGGIVGTVTGERVDTLLNGFTKMRDENYAGKKYGPLMGILAEARGVTESTLPAYELFVPQKLDEGLRKNTIENTANDTVAAFKDGGQYLTQSFKDSLTRAGLRTNMQALHNALGFDALKEVLEDTAKMNVLKNQLEDQVLGYKQGSTYLTLTKALAHNRVVGGSKVRHLLMSTRNIARLSGLNESAQVADQAAAVQPLLDQLQAVYGWQYAPSTARKDFQQVLRTEAARDAKDGNGLEFMFKLHRGIQEQALRDNFAGTEALAISGYTSEITDSKIEVIHAMEKDRAYYEKRGYQYAGEVQKDPLAGTVTGEIQMTRRGSGQVGLVSGAMSTTGMHMKGTRMDGRYYDVLASQPSYTDDAITIGKAIAPGVKAMMQIDGKTFDPRMVQETYVAPLLNPNEEVVGYRHMMTEQNRDSLLDRDNSFDQVLGTMAGETIDKTNSVKQNMDVVRAMYDQYKADYTNRPSSFVRVGLASTDPSLVEMYRLLPEATKMEIKRLFGTENMMIPADQLTMVMGYRKLSLTTPFSMAAEERNALQNAYVSVFESIFGEKAALQVGKAEDVIQEMVKMTKDILVVKNISTLVGNILSNNTVLAAYGVGPIQGLKDMVVAYRAAVDYRKDARRLMTLQRALDVGYLPAGDKKVRDEIAVLQYRLDNNVIKELVDAGMMPTIVEDVEVNDDRYSYKSRLGKKFERIANAVPKPISWTWKNAIYLTHDSSAYKFLSQTTQLSDLTARYALHKQLTTRKQDPMSNAESLRRVSDAFVNYDIPSHPTVQFMNDMGAVMFTKYYFRIQKVLFTLMKEKPARLMAMVVMHKMFPGMQSVLDSSFVNKLGGNPLQNGPLGYLPSLKELPVFKGLMSYF